MEDDKLQLRDLAPADPFLQSPGWPAWVWVLTVGVLVAVSWWIVRATRRHRDPLPPPLAAVAENAFRTAAGRIEEAAGQSSIQKAATQCSTALREYLATICGDRSLFETHEEFLARHEALDGFPEGIRHSVEIGFGQLARLKYGKDRSDEAVPVSNDALKLLEELHQHRPT